MNFRKLIQKQILLYISIFILFLVCFNQNPVEAISIENDKLIKKISVDYTRKFCNSIAFGLSKESAMTFANKENNLIFEKRKVLNNLNKELIANEISISVVEACGYNINLQGQKGIEEFEKQYLESN